MPVLIQALKQKLPVLETGNPHEVRLQCPNCRKQGNTFKDFKLYLNVDKKLWHCKRCEETGGWRRFLSLINITSLNIPTPSLKALKKELYESRHKAQPNCQSPESILPRHVLPAWRHARARTHLLKRGFSQSTAERHGFLYCTRGYFQNRLILPVFNEHGKYRTFAARHLPYGIIERYQRKHDLRTAEKYLYPKGFAVSGILGYLYSHKKSKRRRFVIIGEGLFDAIHLLPYGVCSFGAHLSDAQIALLRKYKIRRVAICYDHDTKKVARANVRKATRKIAGKLRLAGFKVCIVWLPKRGTDPTDYPKQKIFAWVKQKFLQQV